MAIPLNGGGRPDNRLAWNNVDLDDQRTYAVEF
jgi:hypothetical protein